MKTIEDRIDHWLNDYPLVEVDEHSLLREAAEELRRLREGLRKADDALAEAQVQTTSGHFGRYYQEARDVIDSLLSGSGEGG